MPGNIFAYRQHVVVNNKLAFKMQWAAWLTGTFS